LKRLFVAEDRQSDAPDCWILAVVFASMVKIWWAVLAGGN